MEREPTVKERIELFIQRLLDNGFVEQDEDEVQQYIMFFIGTPLDTRIFKKDIITICISESSKTKTMYPKTYDWIQRYLHNFEETKSHMNEFRTNMINKNLLKPDSKVGLKQIKDLIFNSDNDNMKKLFNTYKSKRQFVKDFNSVPITSIGDNKTLV